MRKLLMARTPAGCAAALWCDRRAGSKIARGWRSSGGAPLEIDARVDQHVGEVADQLEDEPDQREHVERAEHDRVVAVDRRLEAEEPQAVQREDDLNQEGARKEDADERRRKPRT